MKLAYFSSFPDYTSENFSMSQYVNTYLTSNVIINASSSDVYYAPHKSTLTIKSVFSGEENYATNNCRYRVKKDNYLILNAGEEYESRIQSENKVQSFSIFFHPDFVKDAYSSLTLTDEKLLERNNRKETPRFIQKLYTKDFFIQRAFSEIENLSSNFNDNKLKLEEEISSLMSFIFSAQNDIYKEIEKVPAAKKSTKIELYKKLHTVKDYLESCYNEKINLNDLAKISCLCEHYMLREFRKYFNATPHQYLTNVRLEASKDMLVNSDKSISEISSSLSFSHQSSFTQLFTGKYKISPMTFRKLHSKKVNFQ
jgi:AraC-like DNA-binding protein